MVCYNLHIKKPAEKEIKKILAKDRSRVIKKILTLKENSQPFGSEKLKGEDFYRLRQGNYRIVYQIDESYKVITVIKVGHRREIYR